MNLVYSPGAGGVYRLEGSWAETVHRGGSIGMFAQGTPRKKANLSHWIYCQNLEARLLNPDDHTRTPRYAVMNRREAELTKLAPTLDHATMVAQYGRIPFARDRGLWLLSVMLRQPDIRLPKDETTLKLMYADYMGFRSAAAARANPDEEEEFLHHFEQKGWLLQRPRPVSIREGAKVFPAVCSLKARLWVEEQLRERGTGQQVFVAMLFDNSLDQADKEGFGKGITQAGSTYYRVDKDGHHSDKLDDWALTGIRQSRIVVADFTCEKFTRKDSAQPEGLPNGNVHYVAGFDHGLGLPVIYTCREDWKGYLCFDTRQINHIFWAKAADLARQLQERPEGEFGHGPVQQAPNA